MWTGVLLKGVSIAVKYVHVRPERESEITIHMKCIEEMEKFKSNCGGEILVVTGFDPTSFQISAGSNIKCPDLYNTQEEADTIFSMQSKQPAEWRDSSSCC